MVHRTPFILPLLYPALTWRLPPGSKSLFLTFDDGPVYGPTEFVLETLKSKTSKATFFCIGDNVQKQPRLFQQIVADGHAVGNHTFNHLNGWKSRTPVYIDNVHQSDAAMKSVCHQSTTSLFRPPYGRISRKQISLLSQYKIIMWDVLTIDYRSALSKERCLSNSINATRDGSIIVFHDSIKAEKNLRYVLPRFIDHFQDLGFTFNPIPL